MTSSSKRKIIKLCATQSTASTTSTTSTLRSVLRNMNCSSSVGWPPTCTRRTAAGRNQYPFQSKTSCTRTPWSPRLYLHRLKLLKSCFRTLLTSETRNVSPRSSTFASISSAPTLSRSFHGNMGSTTSTCHTRSKYSVH